MINDQHAKYFSFELRSQLHNKTSIDGRNFRKCIHILLMKLSHFRNGLNFVKIKGNIYESSKIRTSICTVYVNIHTEVHIMMAIRKLSQTALFRNFCIRKSKSLRIAIYAWHRYGQQWCSQLELSNDGYFTPISIPETLRTEAFRQLFDEMCYRP